MGPLCGVIDQRAAERLNHHADRYGFDGISVGGVLSWLMEFLDQGLVTPEELGVQAKPVFSTSGFSLETDSMHNAELGMQLLDGIIQRRGRLDLSEGAGRQRHWARRKAGS
jgi:glyceraldehyde-3-phosphate dehydrogenase (ferredoxin)